ncbi:MAG: nucleotide exchange factor GrpE [Bacteroidota bacterium]|nr:nucleotide exchange factor GrpE [Bacteroidota bacterium]MDX5448938.1 nucleotide exchange factor GrpE [Bacteroidota bacterium]MDX5505689.1 nucleotide exchange factor GrpE [Bacteroidota bacterium]
MSEKKEPNTTEERHEDLMEEKGASVDNHEEDLDPSNLEQEVPENMDALKEEIQREKDQYLRLFAEFENFRRRTAKERVELFATSTRELMSALLPVIDDFERALKNIEDEKAREGVKLIYDKMLNTLKSKGLQPMPSTVNQPFDVESMEAVTHIPAQSEDQHGKVVDELERGYNLNDRPIRYAKVVVAQKQGQ